MGILKVEKQTDTPIWGRRVAFTGRVLVQSRQQCSLRPYTIFVYEPAFPQMQTKGLTGAPLLAQGAAAPAAPAEGRQGVLGLSLKSSFCPQQEPKHQRGPSEVMARCQPQPGCCFRGWPG